ncbi:YoaK family protein [Streptococcus halichoeri]|uniref:YoaK family protein n=1 Tax=Streptococcus halichoeri TaxID=254785 RepID=UPI002E2CEEEA|nr:YoaK family protein [Streptococcus halichoeri]
MPSQTIMPQNSRFNAIALGFMGGALDIYCQIHYNSLVATQTGNILLLIANIHSQALAETLIRLCSILFFSLGFIFGIILKNHAKSAFWRVHAIAPLILLTFLLPFLPETKLVLVSLLAIATGMLTLTFSGSQIETHSYTILMTSGNYRKMLSSWFAYLTSKEKSPLLKREAINYSLVVGSFVSGAFSIFLLEPLLHRKTIWLVSLSLVLVIYHYSSNVIRYKLHYINI